MWSIHPTFIKRTPIPPRHFLAPQSLRRLIPSIIQRVLAIVTIIWDVRTRSWGTWEKEGNICDIHYEAYTRLKITTWNQLKMKDISGTYCFNLYARHLIKVKWQSWRRAVMGQEITKPTSSCMWKLAMSSRAILRHAADHWIPNVTPIWVGEVKRWGACI